MLKDYHLSVRTYGGVQMYSIRYLPVTVVPKAVLSLLSSIAIVTLSVLSLVYVPPFPSYPLGDHGFDSRDKRARRGVHHDGRAGLTLNT